MHREARFNVLALAGLLAGLAASPAARATSALELVGATTGGHQLMARVLSDSSAVTYFNPSRLPDATPKLEVGLFGVAVQSTIRLGVRPYGVDVPPTVYSTSAPFRPRATEQLPNLRADTDVTSTVYYAAIGLVRPLAGKALVFGLHTLLPVRSFLDQKSFFVDEREQFFSNQLHPELLGDRLNLSSITFALGSQLNDWIAVGAGIDIAILTETKTAIYMPDASNQGDVRLSPDIHTNSKFRPYLAASARPTERSSLVVTLHMPIANEMQGTNNIRFWNVESEVPQTYTVSQGSEPLRIALGGSYGGLRLPDGRQPWEVGVQLLAERWSQYRDRQGDRPQDSWRDTVRVTTGGGFLWRERHVTVDLGYIPSPVPDQTGQTNYVDNARLVMSMGIEGPVKFLGRDLEAGITLFGSYFLPRRATKDPYAANPVIDEFPDDSKDLTTGQPAAGAFGLQTNNPGYPGWKATGYMIGAGATFRIAR